MFIQLFQHYVGKGFSFLYWTDLSKINWLYTYGSLSKLYILFYWSIFLCLHQFTVLNIIIVKYLFSNTPSLYMFTHQYSIFSCKQSPLTALFVTYYLYELKSVFQWFIFIPVFNYFRYTSCPTFVQINYIKLSSKSLGWFSIFF